MLTSKPKQNLAETLDKYAGRRICGLNATECQELVAAYGDMTRELNAGHDPDDAQVWQAVLYDNMDAESYEEVI